MAETVRSVLASHPVAVGYLFGSLARGQTHPRSDVDVAVAFEPEADDSGSERRFSLGADLAVELGRDDVDVVDLRRASPRLAHSVVAHGERLVGDDETERRLRRTLPTPDDDRPSPTERFDDALAAIEGHLE